MAIECVCRAAIKASPAACFAAFANPAEWSAWARDLDRVDVLHPGDAERPARVRMAVTILGVEHHAVLDVQADPAASVLNCTLVESDEASGIDAAFRFDPDGSGATMRADLRVTLVRAHGQRIERMVSRKLETTLTRDLVRHIERTERAARR